ncbi:hypothetical protein EHS25_006739 [Saitozyma podzolica]|uniref:RRM domain-containing protein n=1 Tax=Saitozyma podzolica TaxID=1890683 RepID=A0A427YSX2_9TREE|nr:hypothetical protein EHS25_006739 [Saitozyma podzolica]
MASEQPVGAHITAKLTIKKAAPRKVLGDGPNAKGLINYLSSEQITITDLHWWTTDMHLLEAANIAGVELRLHDISFAEHKVNGKSKGIATINCRSPEKASKLVHWFHSNEFQGKSITPSYVTGTPIKMGQAALAPLRPLANLGLSANFATNAHRGINFNRLRPHNRQVVQQALGIGAGSSRGEHGRGGNAKGASGHGHGATGSMSGMAHDEWSSAGINFEYYPRQAANAFVTYDSYAPQSF